MSGGRVLATPAALEAARQLHSLLAGPIRNDLQAVVSRGQVLADPNQWEGREAQQFRTQAWPQASASMRQLLPAIEQLQSQAEQVVANIMQAGSSGAGGPGPAPGLTGNPLLLAPLGYAGLYYPLRSWQDAVDGKVTWGRPQTLRDHVWGGPTRPNGPPHGPDFGVRTQGQYTRQATDFLRDAPAKGYDVKVAGNTIRVYDPATNTFGSYNLNGTTKTFFKPPNGATYWNSQPGHPPTGGQLTGAIGDAQRLETEARSTPLARIGAMADSPAGRVVSKGMTGLAVVGDVMTIANPSPGALGGARTEQVMAGLNLGAMAVTAGPMSELLLANAATDAIPGVGEVVMAGTAAYLVGDLVYQNREAIGHALDWTGNEAVHLGSDVGHDITSGASHVWHSIFG
ncbi:MAG: hypothetical protein J2P45_17595 [Candidatus Dormibacteraeota bacterium]|nr:hypothetical protein [Candidatus Dormibacteraeota bacterium]